MAKIDIRGNHNIDLLPFVLLNKTCLIVVKLDPEAGDLQTQLNDVMIELQALREENKSLKENNKDLNRRLNISNNAVQECCLMRTIKCIVRGPCRNPSPED